MIRLRPLLRRRPSFFRSIATTTDQSKNNNKRKHFWSSSELCQLSEQTIRDTQQNDIGRLKNEHVFNLLEAWMEQCMAQQNVEWAQRAQQLLLVVSPHRQLVETSHYDVVLQAYSECCHGNVQAAELAQQLLMSQLEHCRNNVHWPKPTVKSFNIVLKCWARTQSPMAAKKAEALIQTLHDYSKYCIENKLSKGCWVNEHSMVSLFSCLAWTKNGGETASALLQALLEGENDLFRHVTIDLPVFNAVIYAWVKQGGARAPQQAENTLRLLLDWSDHNIRPNRITYSMIMNAWASMEGRQHTGAAARRAETILLQMMRRYRGGDESVKPNAVSFSTCISAWSQAAVKDPHAPERAEKLWDMMLEWYQEKNDPEFAPSEATDCAVVLAWARCRCRPDSVEGALRVLEKIKATGSVTLATYNSVLDAMSKQGRAEEALQLLQWLDQSPHLAPDLVTYNSVLAALSRSRMNRTHYAQVSEQILHQMDAMAKTNRNLRPDKLSFTATINAWARADSADKAARAKALVDEMVKRYKAGELSMKPDVFVFTVLIKSCAHSKVNQAYAWSVALKALDALETPEYGPPNEIAYATMMTAINRLCVSSEERDRLFEDVIRRCGERGLLSNQVLHEMNRGGIAQSVLDKVTTRWRFNLSWSANVPPPDRPPR